MIGKKHSLWFLSGYTVDTFALNPISRKVGPAPGTAMVATEDGVFFTAIDGNTYVYDGARVRLLSEKVIPVEPTSGYVSLAYIAGKLYVLGMTTMVTTMPMAAAMTTSTGTGGSGRGSSTRATIRAAAHPRNSFMPRGKRTASAAPSHSSHPTWV